MQHTADCDVVGFLKQKQKNLPCRNSYETLCNTATSSIYHPKSILLNPAISLMTSSIYTFAISLNLTGIYRS